MAILKRVLPCVTLVLMTGCAGYTVRHDYDVRNDFSAYKSYDWTTGKETGKGQTSSAHAILVNRVTFHMDKVLAEKGFHREKTADPDFLVAFTPSFKNVVVSQSSGVGIGTGFGFGPFRFHTGTRVGRTRTVPEGSIVIEIFDFKTKQVVWEGTAEGALSGVDTPEDGEEKAAAAVRSLLARFPPKRQ